MFETTFVDTGVGRLKVTTAGAGPPAVLWHSLFVDECSWQRVAPELARDRRLVLITGPAHGQSGDLHRRFDLRQCAAAAVAVTEALGVVEPVDWVGNAWGGHVGVRFATAYPHRIRSLVTIGSPIQELAPTERVRTRLLLMVHRLLGPNGFLTAAVVETLLSEPTRAGDPQAVELVRRGFVTADPGRLRNAVVSISLHREDLAALLPTITVPTLMVTGDRHTGWTPEQCAAAVATMPDARAAVIADAAYLVPLEQPAAVIGLVRDFWAAVSVAPTEEQR